MVVLKVSWCGISLPALKGAVPDPYVELSFPGSRPRRTASLTATADPVFNERADEAHVFAVCHYTIQPLVELCGGCVVVLKFS